MIKIDVPFDNAIIQVLETWRKTISFTDAYIGSELIDDDTYEVYEDKSSILSLLSEDYLNNTIIPNEGNHDFGDANLVNLDPNSPYHDTIFKTLQEELEIKDLKLDKMSGAFWYPPTGYMGWHSNADHEAYRMYAAWSEEGHKSFFRYRDPNTKQIRVAF